MAMWKNANVEVSQGSILGPLLFLIHTNDLTDGLSSKANMFADNPYLFSVTMDILNQDSQLIISLLIDP